MERRYISRLDTKISLLGFGCMRLPRCNAETQDIDYKAAESLVDHAIAAGVNYFDTAWMYHGGKSEAFIGHALRKYPRESFFLADKLPIWSVETPEDVDRIFTEQLKRCQVEYFDFYLAHNLNRDNYEIFERNGVHALLREKQKEGRIKHLGFSFHDNTDLLRKIVTEYTWDFAQIQLNYLDWEGLDAKGQYAALVEQNLPVFVMEPVRGGALATLNDTGLALLREVNAEASPASWAIRFAASLPGVAVVLSGMSAMEQLVDNLKTMEEFRPLDEGERAVLSKVAMEYRASGAIPCTACRYCMDCPAGVDIPRVFSAYNTYRTTDSKLRFFVDYRSLRESEQAHNCIECGQCQEHCPQSIDIPGTMRMIGETAVALEKS